MVIIKLVVVFLFIGVGVSYVKSENWMLFMLFGFLGVVIGVVIVFFVYIGFDVVVIVVEEVCKF